MNTALGAFSAVFRTLFCPAILCFVMTSSNALGNESRASILKNAPLSLPRLAPNAHMLGEKPMHKEAFEVFEMLNLSETDQATLDERHGVVYLQIEPGAVWQQKLRNQQPVLNYTTFTLNASLGTAINIAGASLVIEPSERDAAYASIHAVGPEKRVIHETPWLLFNGRRMASLSIVTIQVNRKANTWSIWFRDMLLATDLPLVRQPHPSGQFEVVAGKGGAWLCGLVNGDENPLFEDSNGNAVPDEFERKTMGRLLENNAAKESVTSLRKAWLKDKLTRGPAEFILTTPLPDSFPEDCAPEGEIVHGMLGGLKFGAPKKN